MENFALHRIILLCVEFSPLCSTGRAVEKTINTNRSRYFEKVDDGEVQFPDDGTRTRTLLDYKLSALTIELNSSILLLGTS